MLNPINEDELNQYGGVPLRPQAEIMSILMEDEKKRGMGDVAPDTAGADYFFVQYFMTDDMYWDFDRIEEDFMKHCYDRLREFSDVQWYENLEAKYVGPDKSHRMMTLGLILNGAKLNDEYCRGLIKYLFKAYHKSLYKQLKRFSRISADEILSLAEYEGELDLGHIGIILTMCSINGIELKERTGFLYSYLDKKRITFIEEDKVDFRLEDYIDDNVFEESRAQVEKWVEEDKKKNPQYRKQLKTHWKVDEFAASCLKMFSYPEDYLYTSLENNMGIVIQFTRTLATLKRTFPKKEFSFEDVQRYTTLYSAMSALVNVSDNLDDVNRRFLGIETEYDCWDDDTLFHPENIVVSNAPKAKDDKMLITNIAPVVDDNASKEDYLSEIQELRKKLNQKEIENKQLKGQLASVNSAKKEVEHLINKYENDREELIALREFAYRLEQEVPEYKKISLDDMRKQIEDKSYVIIGGHINWVNKLKSEFPKWTYILPSEYNTADVNSLENKDMIFFFTDHISHVAYGKFVSSARDKKIPFSYLHGVNIDQVIRQIYEGGK